MNMAVCPAGSRLPADKRIQIIATGMRLQPYDLYALYPLRPFAGQIPLGKKIPFRGFYLKRKVAFTRMVISPSADCR